MAVSEIVGYLVAFLLGTATGAAGHYFGAKYTEERQLKERDASFRRSFNDARKIMPKLFEEMECDVRESDPTIREFVILSTEHVMFNSDKKRFVYYENAHKDLRNKIDLLSSKGFLIEMPAKNVPIYRMSDHFYEALKGHWT